MSSVSIRLFGKFSAQIAPEKIEGLEAPRLQELFSYLLLYRERPHARETLAALLWGDSPTATSKKYLRQALWQLQSALTDAAPSARHLLIVEPDWIQIDPDAGLWLDVAEFEQSFNLVQGVRGPELDVAGARSLEEAVALYKADLLEACYEDWCIYERERLQNMFLAMLDKLMSYCESHDQYENGLQYGARILAYDRAREHTHRRLMRLHYLEGNRTAALRQYERCVAALQEELGVKPAKRTTDLYDQVRADSLDGSLAARQAEASASSPPEALVRLRQIRSLLVDIQREIQKDIQAVELAIRGRR
ncbi:MAG: BTAD domain-containing putative transcriptional regulator [Acidobacteriota bacterium]